MTKPAMSDLIEDLENADPFEWPSSVSNLCEKAAAALRASAEREAALVEALEKVINAEALAGLRRQVAGWNGEGMPDGPYARHPRGLGATLPKTNCGAIYDLDDAIQSAREALAAAKGENNDAG